MRNAETFCDIAIKVGERIFKAHKNVLVSFSNHFKEILCVPDIDEVAIDGESKTFERLIDFVYTGQMRGISPNTVMDTLNMACTLQMKPAIDILAQYFAEEFEAESITLETAMHISSRQEPELKSLREKSNDYVAHLISLDLSQAVSLV